MGEHPLISVVFRKFYINLIFELNKCYTVIFSV